MAGFLFLTIFGVSFLWLPGEGQLQAPSAGSTLVFTNGSTAKITWPYKADISKLNFRSWSFISSKTKKLETLATIVGNGTSVTKSASSLHDFEIETPTTLILKNIDVTYDGTYQFVLTPSRDAVSNVVVYIAEKPTVNLNCSSSIIVNAGDNVRCVCSGENGNPSPNVAWYKDDIRIGDFQLKQNLLTIINVREKDSGTYKCVAQSHVNVTDEKSIKVVLKGHNNSQQKSYNDSRTIWYILVVSLVFLGVVIGYISLLIMFCKLRRQFKAVDSGSELNIHRKRNGTDVLRSGVVNSLRNVGGSFDAYARMT
ncbi:tyrosine-protein kinase-like otk [Dendronephthya gigantea]|uniref:tyrosine-protein kinase-like otk n=1 Tax=Dendronephthya gigantea TaxID=151771 RepID=UPI00106CA6FE|nr:tyrosine-protein kinase-like otk [Dendronephthya gigantea]